MYQFLRVAILVFLLSQQSCAVACEHLVEQESNDFDKRVVDQVCRADLDDFNGIFLDLGRAIVAVPSEYKMISFSEESVQFVLKDEEISTRVAYFFLRVGRRSSSLSSVAEAIESVESQIVQRAKNQCGVDIEVKQLTASFPGSESKLEVVEARIGDWLFSTSGRSTGLVLALIDASRKLACY